MPSGSINQPINRSTNTLYADVILPLSLPGLLTYAVPEGLQDHAIPGVRVRVQVGKKKTYAALIHHIHREKPSGYEVRPLLAILDPEPFVNSLQLRLWDWMADYYMCSPGDIYRAAIPAGFKTEVASYKPKTTCYIRLSKEWREEKKLHLLLDKLARAPVQQKLVMRYLGISGFPEKRRPEWIEQPVLLDASTKDAPVLKSLVKKRIFETDQREVSRLDIFSAELQGPELLNDNQAIALHAIKQQFEKKMWFCFMALPPAGKPRSTFTSSLKNWKRAGRCCTCCLRLR